jgi:hypothetical protein
MLARPSRLLPHNAHIQYTRLYLALNPNDRSSRACLRFDKLQIPVH